MTKYPTPTSLNGVYHNGAILTHCQYHNYKHSTFYYSNMHTCIVGQALFRFLRPAVPTDWMVYNNIYYICYYWDTQWHKYQSILNTFHAAFIVQYVQKCYHFSLWWTVLNYNTIWPTIHSNHNLYYKWAFATSRNLLTFHMNAQWHIYC